MILTLNEIYASGGQFPYYALVITNEVIGELRLVLANKDMTLNGKEYVATSFTVQLPSRSDNGFSDLSFAVDNTDGQAYVYIKKVLDNDNRTVTYLTLQQFNYGDLSLVSSLTLTLTGAQLDRSKVQFTASFCDMLNTEFPKLRYTDNNAPGLKYVS